jgi:hypothetical protein
VNATVFSILAGTSWLTLAALVALWLALIRRPAVGTPADRRRLARLAALTLAIQAAHFAEELATGFYIRFPQLLGLLPWPRTFFVWFNLLWIAAWTISLPGLRFGARAAYFPTWFLAIGGTTNGLVHPLLALLVSGYFPGLWTSPLIGVAGYLLLRSMVSSTLPVSSPEG